MLVAFQCPQCGSYTVVDGAAAQVMCASCSVTSPQEPQAPMFRPAPPPPRPTSAPRPMSPPPPVPPPAFRPPPPLTSPTTTIARKNGRTVAMVFLGVLGAGIAIAVNAGKSRSGPGEDKAAAVAATAVKVAQPMGPLRWAQGGPPVVVTVGGRRLFIGRVEQAGYWVVAFTEAGQTVWRSRIDATTQLVPVGDLLLVEQDDGSVHALDLVTGADRMVVTSPSQLASACGVDGELVAGSPELLSCLARVPRATQVRRLELAAEVDKLPRVRQVDVRYVMRSGDLLLAQGTATRGDRDEVLVLQRDDKILWKVSSPRSEGAVPSFADISEQGLLLIVHGLEQAELFYVRLSDGGVAWSHVVGDEQDTYESTYVLDDRVFALTLDRLVVIDTRSGESVQIGD